MAVKTVDSIDLINPGYKYIRNPFANWKKYLNTNKAKLIASISFARNIIFEVAEEIYAEQGELGLNLENKVVLSIATRINAERYMIQRISNPTFVSEIRSNQTGKLFGKFKTDFPSEIEQIKILEKVNLMTPENIPLNSFMFEPILDLSEHHLKDLYASVKALIYAEELGLQYVAASGEEKPA